MSSCSCTHVAHVLVDLLVWQVTKFVRVRILVVDELAEERDVDEGEGRFPRRGARAVDESAQAS